MLLAGLLLGACSTYDERLQPAQRAFYQGSLEEAAARIEGRLEADEADRLVLQLELASVLQAQERFDEAAALLVRVDDDLEVLDYTRDPLRRIADFIFASSSAEWRASPPERVMLNTQNMLNFLALGRPGEAAVEARRLRLLLTMEDVAEEELFANTFAWGLAGLSFELAGRPEEAQDAFRDAGLTPLRNELPAAGFPVPDEGSRRDPASRPGVVLVVVQNGQVPVRKEAVFLLFVAGVLHRVNVPSLVSRWRTFETADVTLDGIAQGAAPVVFDLGQHVRERYDQEFPRLLAAAATQVIPRALTAQAVRQGMEHSGSDDVQAFAGLTAFLTEWILAEVQVADTRCWSLLPERFHALRLNVPPGPHTVQVRLGGLRQQLVERQVDVPPGGVAVVNVVTGPHEGFRPLPSPRERDLRDAPEGEQALRILEQALLLNEILSG